jgi:hypothetical protein
VYLKRIQIPAFSEAPRSLAGAVSRGSRSASLSGDRASGRLTYHDVGADIALIPALDEEMHRLAISVDAADYDRFDKILLVQRRKQRSAPSLHRGEGGAVAMPNWPTEAQ